MKRTIAMIIDILIILVYAGSLYVLNTSFDLVTSTVSELTSNLIGILSMILPGGLYFILLEYKFGASLGKMVMKLEVTDVDDNKVKLNNLCLRTVLFVLPWIFGHLFVYRGFFSEWSELPLLIVWAMLSYGLLLLNYILMLVTKKKQGFHGLLSHTKVVSQ